MRHDDTAPRPFARPGSWSARGGRISCGPSVRAGGFDPKRFVARFRMLVAVMLAVVASGCSLSTSVRAICGPYEECKRREALRLGAAMEARRIWDVCYAERFESHPSESDFKQGFVTAFVEAALGGNGCPPPVPTRSLLSWEALTNSYPNGEAWFAGFRLGHASALSNGVHLRRLAPVDPGLIAATHREHASQGFTSRSASDQPASEWSDGPPVTPESIVPGTSESIVPGTSVVPESNSPEPRGNSPSDLPPVD